MADEDEDVMDASAIKDRQKLIRTAQEVMVELRKITVPVNELINELLGTRDRLALRAADEREYVNERISGKIRVAKLAGDDKPHRTIEKEDGTVEHRRMRKCGKCGEYGHNARTCTNDEGAPEDVGEGEEQNDENENPTGGSGGLFRRG